MGIIDLPAYRKQKALEEFLKVLKNCPPHQAAQLQRINSLLDSCNRSLDKLKKGLTLTEEEVKIKQSANPGHCFEE